MRKKSKKEILRGPAFDYTDKLSDTVKDHLEGLFCLFTPEYKINELIKPAIRKWIYYFYVGKFPSATITVDGKPNEVYFSEAAESARYSTTLLLNTLKYGWRLKWIAAAYIGNLLMMALTVFGFRDAGNKYYFALMVLAIVSCALVISYSRICYKLEKFGNDKAMVISLLNFILMACIFLISGYR